MHCKTLTILLRIRARGHFVMSIIKNRESHYVTVLDNPLKKGNVFFFEHVNLHDSRLPILQIFKAYHFVLIKTSQYLESSKTYDMTGRA